MDLLLSTAVNHPLIHENYTRISGFSILHHCCYHSVAMPNLTHVSDYCFRVALLFNNPCVRVFVCVQKMNQNDYMETSQPERPTTKRKKQKNTRWNKCYSKWQKIQSIHAPFDRSDVNENNRGPLIKKHSFQWWKLIDILWCVLPLMFMCNVQMDTTHKTQLLLLYSTRPMIAQIEIKDTYNTYTYIIMNSHQQELGSERNSWPKLKATMSHLATDRSQRFVPV